MIKPIIAELGPLDFSLDRLCDCCESKILEVGDKIWINRKRTIIICQHKDEIITSRKLG